MTLGGMGRESIGIEFLGYVVSYYNSYRKIVGEWSWYLFRLLHHVVWFCYTPLTSPEGPCTQ